MTFQHKFAGGLAVFALFAWIAAPFVAPSPLAAAQAAGDVSIAISSGSHLQLIDEATDNSARDRGHLLCRRVYRLAIADIGVRCKRPDPARQIVRLDPQ